MDKENINEKELTSDRCDSEDFMDRYISCLNEIEERRYNSVCFLERIYKRNISSLYPSDEELIKMLKEFKNKE